MKCDKYYGFQSWNVINTTVKCDKYYGAEDCSWIMIIWLILVIIAQKYAWIKELTSKCDKYYGCFSIGPGSVKKFLVVFLMHRKQGYWGGKLREKITLQEAKCEKYYGRFSTGLLSVQGRTTNQKVHMHICTCACAYVHVHTRPIKKPEKLRMYREFFRHRRQILISLLLFSSTDAWRMEWIYAFRLHPDASARALSFA